FAKISAAIIGGYLVAMSLHVALAAWINHVNVLITSTFSGFIVWATLMIVAFLSKQGWRIWLLYLVLTIVLMGIAYLGKMYNPEFLQREETTMALTTFIHHHSTNYNYI
ncbi:MAG: hypothetical protein ACOYXT_24365, partial [Bacteroidota bacterium]